MKRKNGEWTKKREERGGGGNICYFNPITVQQFVFHALMGKRKATKEEREIVRNIESNRHYC